MILFFLNFLNTDKTVDKTKYSGYDLELIISHPIWSKTFKSPFLFNRKADPKYDSFAVPFFLLCIYWIAVAIVKSGLRLISFPDLSLKFKAYFLKPSPERLVRRSVSMTISRSIKSKPFFLKIFNIFFEIFSLFFLFI